MKLRLAKVALVATLGGAAIAVGQTPSPFDPRILSELNQKAGTAKWLPAKAFPRGLEPELLSSKQTRMGTARYARTNYFVLPIDPAETDILERAYRRMVPKESTGNDLSPKTIGRVDGADPWEFLGFTDEGPLRVGRMYRLNNGARLYFLEWDYVKAGASLTGVQENINANINGGLGTMIANMKKDGTVLWRLSWVTEDRMFELFMEGQAPDEIGAMRATNFALAVAR